MAGDPKECRSNALRCAELGQIAKSKQLKMTLLELSKNWVNLAESLETSQALLDEEQHRLSPQQAPAHRLAGIIQALRLRSR